MADLILIVEDEADLVEALSWSFQREGFLVRTASTGQSALLAAAQDPLPDLILLDLMLPDLSGTEVCRRLKSAPRTERIPVIMVTARGEEIDRVVGFEVGADDYVVKPFSARELVLRARAVLRRARPVEEEPGAEGPITFGILRIDHAAHRVWVGEEEAQLTALEFRLLESFLQRRGRVQSREQLLEAAWGEPEDVTVRTVDTHVKRLRQKIGAAGDYIETLRGVGYRFKSRPEEAR